MKFFVRWFVVALSLFGAAWVVPGVHVDDTRGIIAVAIMALVLGLVNAFIRPLLTLLSCGAIAVTLGLFMFVINAVTFWLAAYWAQNVFHVGFYVDSFWSALWGSIAVSIISFLLSIFVKDN